MFPTESPPTDQIDAALEDLASTHGGRDALRAKLAQDGVPRPDQLNGALRVSHLVLGSTVEDIVTARCLAVYLDTGDPDVISESARADAAVAILREVLDTNDYERIRKSALEFIDHASYYVQPHKLNPRKAARVDWVRSALSATVVRLAEAMPSETILGLIAQLLAAQGWHAADVRTRLAAAIETAGGTQTIKLGLFALRDAREPIESDATLAGLLNDIRAAEAAQGRAEAAEVDAPASWAASDVAERLSDLRQRGETLRDGIVRARKADIDRLVDGTAEGGWETSSKLIAELKPFTSTEAVALSQALHSARRAATTALAPAWVAAFRVGGWLMAVDEANTPKGSPLASFLESAQAKESREVTAQAQLAANKERLRRSMKDDDEPAPVPTSAPAAQATARAETRIIRPLAGLDSNDLNFSRSSDDDAAMDYDISKNFAKMNGPDAFRQFMEANPEPVKPIKTDANYWLSLDFSTEEARKLARNFTDWPKSTFDPVLARELDRKRAQEKARATS